MTNGEYIRQSDAALSTVLLNCGKISCCDYCKYQDIDCQAYNCSCIAGINEWLREEHKDGTD